MWRTLRPSAGQAQQWVSECVWFLSSSLTVNKLNANCGGVRNRPLKTYHFTKIARPLILHISTWLSYNGDDSLEANNRTAVYRPHSVTLLNRCMRVEISPANDVIPSNTKDEKLTSVAWQPPSVACPNDFHRRFLIKDYYQTQKKSHSLERYCNRRLHASATTVLATTLLHVNKARKLIPQN